MTPKQFQRFLDRDGGCLHCGRVDQAIPHHRINRGMGGSKERNVASNIIVLCSLVNGDLESVPSVARRGRQWGWKLESWQDPREVPVFIPKLGVWVYLDDDYRAIVTADEIRPNMP